MKRLVKLITRFTTLREKTERCHKLLPGAKLFVIKYTIGLSVSTCVDLTHSNRKPSAKMILWVLSVRCNDEVRPPPPALWDDSLSRCIWFRNPRIYFCHVRVIRTFMRRRFPCHSTTCQRQWVCPPQRKHWFKLFGGFKLESPSRVHWLEKEKKNKKKHITDVEARKHCLLSSSSPANTYLNRFFVFFLSLWHYDTKR